MVGALVVLLGVVGAFVGLREINRDDPPSPVREVDYGKVADLARERADFDLVAPASLPPGWRATTVNYVDGEDAHWHLGLLTDQVRYVGLEQADSSPKSMVQTYVDETATPGESVEVAGVEWSTWADDEGDLALVRETPGTTTVVVGHEVSEAVLVDFAASLR